MRYLSFSLLSCVLAGCGGSVLADAEGKAAAACECTDADCVRPIIRWFNEQSLKDGGAALEGLSDEDKGKFKKLSLQAADCQMKIKSGN